MLHSGRVMTALEAVEALEARNRNRTTTKPTGFTRVDEVTGGFARGQVWIIVGTPGQGRSTLATQWALRLAAQLDMRTDLISLKDPEHRVAVRLLACAGKIPVPHLWTDELNDEDRLRLERAKTVLSAAELRITGPGHISSLDADPDHDELPEALVADDANLGAGVFPARIAAFATAGVLVLLTLRRDQVVGSAGLDADWAQVADFIIDIDRPDLLNWHSQRPGEADIRIIRNRWGPQLQTTVGFQGHFARFVEMASRG